MTPFLVLLLAAVATGQVTQTPHCIHTNQQQHTADMVIERVMKEMDANKDGYLSLIEVFTEMFNRFDGNHDSSISQNEFVTKWHALFHDVPEFAGYLFLHFDQNGDGFINLQDAVALNKAFDVDGDGKASDAEFAIYMGHLYKDCVPHTHLQGH